jgi:hypothetical protein
MVVTRWASLDAVRDFAKDELDKAVVAEVAQPYFIRYDDRVSHFTDAFSYGRAAAALADASQANTNRAPIPGTRFSWFLCRRKRRERRSPICNYLVRVHTSLLSILKEAFMFEGLSNVMLNCLGQPSARHTQ